MLVVGKTPNICYISLLLSWRRLGTLFTVLALAVGLGSAFAYDFYFPR
jgi:hypothetical protein